MRALSWFAVFGAAVVSFGCDSTVEPADGSGGAQGSSSHSTGEGAFSGVSTGGPSSAASGASGGGPPGGDCSVDADCADGKCIELAPGGYRVCAHLPDEATACTMPAPPVPDQCCSSADCADGKCFNSFDFPNCGGVPLPEYNLCIADQCQTDDDCIHDNPEPWICIPAGAFGYPARTCRTAYCRTNADCTAEPGGACAPIQNPCCAAPLGLACVYPGGCTKDEDCSTDFTQHCEIDGATGAAVCVEGGIGCPA